jgi:hypothetical protein
MFKPPSNLRSAQNTLHPECLGPTYDGGAGCYKNQSSRGVGPQCDWRFGGVPINTPEFHTALLPLHKHIINPTPLDNTPAEKAKITKIKQMKTAHQATTPEALETSFTELDRSVIF